MEKYEEIDIKRILEIMFSKRLIIALILLFSIALGYAYSYYYKTPQYKSSVTILLVADENKSEQELTQTDLSINSALISTYSNIAKSTKIVNKTIENLGLDMSVTTLQNNIEATQVDKTQFLRISVKDEDPNVAKIIANELATVFTKEIKDIYNLANINIVDKAEVATKPFNINHTKDMIIFGFAGLFMSVVIVMIIYFFDDTVKNENDVERNLKLKNLGTLPFDKKSETLIIETNPKSHIVESIKILRTNILYSTTKKSILITSSKKGEGKSWVSNNLAVAFAQANKKVIYIDTDLRKENNKNEIFNIEKGEGLSDFIRDISDDQIENLEKSKKYIKETNIPNLHILQNGTIPPNPSELLSSNNMRKLIELLQYMYDIVLLDGTPCMTVSDSIAVSSMVDSTILIAENEKTKINDLKKIKKSIEDVGGHISGVILNKAEIQKGKYYGKRYGYYYGKEDAEHDGIKHVQDMVHIDEIIEQAKINIKENLIEAENQEQQIVEEVDNTIDNNKEIFNEVRNVKKDISSELKTFKTYFSDIKNINFYNQKINTEIKDLKEIQANNNSELLNKIESIDFEKGFENLNENIKNINNNINNKDYSEEFENLNENIKNIKNKDYSEDFETLNENIKNINNKDYSGEFENLNENIKNIQNKDYSEDFETLNENIKNINNKDYSKEFETLNQNIKNIQNKDYTEEFDYLNENIRSLKNKDYSEDFESLNENIRNINYEEDFDKINATILAFMNQIESLNNEIRLLKEMQANNNSEILEKVRNINYEEEFAKINDKIENIKAMQQEIDIKEKLDETTDKKENVEVEEKSNNIISFEALRERRKAAKRVFDINEDISFEDLERLSPQVIDLNSLQEFGVATN